MQHSRTLISIALLPLVLAWAGASGLLNAQSLWSEAATWPSGRVPAAGEAVTIPAGAAVVLDVSTPPLRSLTVAGDLSFADGGPGDEPLRLRAGYVYVTGVLRVGSAAEPYRARATITIDGPDEDVMGMGGRFLATGEGGSLRLHGASARKRAWTQLDGSLDSGATRLRLADATAWAVGDELAIAPSGWDPAEAERVRITAIDGRDVAFAPALAHRHYGEVQTYDGRAVDERAEVGLLTRNITVEGPETAAAERFGAHGMVMAGSGPIAVEGVRFRRTGQPGRAARYTFHWHLCGVRDGDYFRDNSIDGALQRGVVVHGTDSVVVERTVAYDVANHAFIPAEDGNEVGNKFRGNLAMWVRQVPKEEFAFPAQFTGGSNQGEHRVSGFWLRNLHNELTGNHVAGAERGVGFFYDAFGKSREHVAFDKGPRNVSFGGNVAHTISSPGPRFHEGFANSAMYQQVGHGHGLFIGKFQIGPDAPLYLFEDFTAYKCDITGIWNDLEDARFTGFVLADNATAFQSGSGFIDNTLVVGQTANDIGGENRGLRHGHHRAGFYSITQAGKRQQPRLTDVTFVDMNVGTREDKPSATFIADYGLSYRDNYYERVRLLGDSRPVWMDSGGARGKKPNSTALWDRDGSLTGRDGGRLVVHSTNGLVRDDCEWAPEWDAYLCPEAEYLDASLEWEGGVRNTFLLTGPTGRVSYDGEFSPRRNRVREGEDFAVGIEYGGEPAEPQQNFTLELRPYAANPGGHAYFTFPFPFDGAHLTDEAGADVPRLASVAAVRAATHPAYYFDAAAAEVFVKAYAPAEGRKHIHFAVGRQSVSAAPAAALANVSGARLWPSPATAATGLAFSLASAAEVRITVSDAAGRLVAVAHEGRLGDGEHVVPVRAAGLAAGVYAVTLEAGAAAETLRLTVL